MNFEDACAIFRSRDVTKFDSAAEVVIETAESPLSDEQIVILCQSLAASGDNVVLPSSLGIFVDVPSTGGPASLTTLLCPILIAVTGFYVPKLSATGSIAGGIDTMGIIPGFKTNLAGMSFIEALTKCGFAHAEPTNNFCPADNFLIKKRRAANMMANSSLAAASLLAKKLATLGTSAMFDFRVGPSGNIGEDPTVAQIAKELFIRIGRQLKLHIDVVLTENRTFPSSALGRFESLNLVWNILSSMPISSLDKLHLDLCIELSARACYLVDNSIEIEKRKTHIISALHNGSAKELFLNHIEAQGANLKNLEEVLNWRKNQQVIPIRTSSEGYWLPPNLDLVKNWIKKSQNELSADSKSATANQIGFCLVRNPSDFVKENTVVAEVRYSNGSLNIPQWLAGSCENTYCAPHSQILD